MLGPSTTAARVGRDSRGAAGPGLLISVGYMDPGNWAADIEARLRFGTALFVVLLSGLSGILLQTLSARLLRTRVSWAGRTASRPDALYRSHTWCRLQRNKHYEARGGSTSGLLEFIA
jgi:hypothetical protein